MIAHGVGRVRERLVALATVLLIPPALRFLSLRRTLMLCDSGPLVADREASPAALADRVRRWLSRGRGPWTVNCLTCSIVLYTMLRQHGYLPRLHVGVRGSRTSFVAHAWVSVDGRPIADDARIGERYREILVHRG